MILVVDNYDSFVWNLARYVGELGYERRVVRNDAITLEEVAALAPTHVLLSPGPGTPREAGISNDLVARFAGAIPILGICLGHLCIGHVLGGRVVRARQPLHGRTSPIDHDGQGVFHGLPRPFDAARYHSLVLDPDTLPDALDVCAWSPEGEIMGVRDASGTLCGVQMHPESVLTRWGYDLLANFLRMRPPR